jgi:hypothetical protein
LVPQHGKGINMEAIVERSSLEPWPYQSGRLAPVRNIVKRVFGCWHLKVSRPFTRGDETYQTCISCGARRRFDLDQWTSVGGFYYPKRQSVLYGSRR